MATSPPATVDHLQHILARETVDTGPNSPALGVRMLLYPMIKEWAGDQLLAFHPSGSFMKGTAIKSGTDIDFFISLSETTTETLKEIYDRLFGRLTEKKYTPKRQNVSINIRALGYSVDLVPAKRQNPGSNDHSLYVRKAGTWQKTNVVTHIEAVRSANRLREIRLIKLWRNQLGLDFPSFYLELAVARALAGRSLGLGDHISLVFEYLRDTFSSARFVDPANTNNVISDELSATDKKKIADAARTARATRLWADIFR
jgi:hypothetical protein